MDSAELDARLVECKLRPVIVGGLGRWAIDDLKQRLDRDQVAAEIDVEAREAFLAGSIASRNPVMNENNPPADAALSMTR